MFTKAFTLLLQKPLELSLPIMYAGSIVVIGSAASAQEMIEGDRTMRRRYMLRAWRSERGSQGLEAAGAALAAALIVLALLAGARSTMGPRVFEAFQCAAAALTGGSGCGGSAAVADGTGTAPQQQQQQDDDGFGWLDGLQIGLDAVGLVPGLGEVADGVNGLISLARGDKTGAALSFAAMVPFAGWAATGGKFVRNGIKYSDEVAGAAKHGDEAADTARRLPCISSSPSRKGPGLAKPLAACDDAYEAAKSGGRHAGWMRDMATKPSNELRRGIRNLEKQIAEHQDKIANPEKHIPDFRSLDPRQQQALLTKKWPGDIARQQEHKQILEGILRERGE